MEHIVIAPIDVLEWLLPVVAVGFLAALTIAFAVYIGRWIDAQGNSVVDKPRERPRRRDE